MIRPFFFPLLLAGCISAPVAPNLKLPEPQACKTIKLDPVPQKVYLDIQGDKVFADAGGEQILRGYVACRGMNK